MLQKAILCANAVDLLIHVPLQIRSLKGILYEVKKKKLLRTVVCAWFRKALSNQSSKLLLECLMMPYQQFRCWSPRNNGHRPQASIAKRCCDCYYLCIYAKCNIHSNQNVPAKNTYMYGQRTLLLVQPPQIQLCRCMHQRDALSRRCTVLHQLCCCW